MRRTGSVLRAEESEVRVLDILQKPMIGEGKKCSFLISYPVSAVAANYSSEVYRTNARVDACMWLQLCCILLRIYIYFHESFSMH